MNSSLSPSEQKLFEDMFGMSSGYVLDFTNAEFERFFRNVVGRKIYDTEYALNGDSKAKRLRCFWDTEYPSIVGKVLEELVNTWLVKYPDKERSTEHIKAEAIFCKLQNKSSLLKKGTSSSNHENQYHTENLFLKQKYSKPDFSEFFDDQTLVAVLNNRFEEAQKSFSVQAYLGAVILLCSLLEGVLLAKALTMPKEFNSDLSAPKNKEGKVKLLPYWTLANLIDVSANVGLLAEDIRKFSHALRDFRNYIHPWEQRARQFHPDEHTARICLQVFLASMDSLSGNRKTSL